MHRETPAEMVFRKANRPSIELCHVLAASLALRQVISSTPDTLAAAWHEEFRAGCRQALLQRMDEKVLHHKRICECSMLADIAKPQASTNRGQTMVGELAERPRDCQRIDGTRSEFATELCLFGGDDGEIEREIVSHTNRLLRQPFVESPQGIASRSSVLE